MNFSLFVWLLVVLQSAGVAFVIALRCILDDDMETSCSESLKGKSLSFLLDWSWVRTMSACFLGASAFLNIWFSFGLLYPCYTHPYNHWYIWLLRFLHAGGFVGVALVGIFSLSEHNSMHMAAAFWLFVALSLECIILLFVPQNRCNVQKLLNISKKDEKIWDEQNYRIWFSLQILHSVLIPVFAILYFFLDYGQFEWISIWLILLYSLWYARDHKMDRIHTGLVEHPNSELECSYGEFVPLKSLQTKSAIII